MYNVLVILTICWEVDWIFFFSYLNWNGKILILKEPIQSKNKDQY